jgi:hypothetical protein
MKFKRKSLVDQCGSSSQCRAVVREVRWGMVEHLSLDDELVIDCGAPATSVAPDSGLPLSFGSGKKKSRKQPCDMQIQVGAVKGAKNSAFPVPPYNGTLLEDHVYYVHEAADDGSEPPMVRIYGIGHSDVRKQHGSVAFGTWIYHHSNGLAGTQVTVNRRDLRVIPSDKRAHAHQLVQKDEQRILQQGMPTGVHLKYWDQRYRLLSRFDKGIQLDDESWYSITPEAVAHHVTASCLGRARELGCKLDKIMDCFSGCGGNTIPFLARQKEVISVDFDPVKLGYLRWAMRVFCNVSL